MISDSYSGLKPTRCSKIMFIGNENILGLFQLSK